MKVSLAGIDAPEISKTKGNTVQPYSQRAREYLVELVLNRLVDIKGYGLDRNDCVLGVIFLEGKNINLEMVRAGYAKAGRGKPLEGLDLRPYQKAEKEAKIAERGIWFFK